MLQRRVVGRVVGAVLALLTLGPAAYAQNGRVSGLVREEGGQPLKGATVTAENTSVGQTFTATSDDKGRFNMIGLRSGEWRFIAQAPGYSPEGGMLNVRGGGQNMPIAFELKHSGVAFFGALGGIVSRDLQADMAAADRLYDQQKWDEAIAAYKALLNRVPVITNINLQIASAYRQKKDYDAAMAAYADILRAEPGNSRAKIESARTSVERGDAKAAETLLLRAAAEPDATRELFYALAEVKLASQDAEGAVTWFEKASTADPYWARPLVRLGEAAIRKGDHAGAARLLARAMAVDPTAPDAATARTLLESLNK